MSVKLPVPGEIKIKNADDRTVVIIGYTGAAVPAEEYGFPHPLVYDMDNFTVANHIPYRLEHDELLGHTLENTIKNGKLTNVAHHSVRSDVSDSTLQEIKEGGRYEASMDAEFKIRDIEFIEEGTVEINNHIHKAPIFIATRGRVTEISATKSGRDSNTLVTKLSNSYDEGRELLMKVKNSKTALDYLDNYEDDKDAVQLIQNAKDGKWTEEKFKEELLKVKNSKKDDPPKEGPVTPPWDGSYLLDHIEDEDATALIKNARTEKWEESKFKDELLKVKNSKNKEVPSFDYLFDHIGDPDAVALIKNARKEGWSEEKFENELKVIKVQNGYPGIPGIHVPSRENGEALCQARLAISLGIDEKVIIKNSGEKVHEQAAQQGPMGIKEAMMLSANANGGRFNGLSDTPNLMKHMKMLVKNSGFSTVNFPNLMHHVAMWKKDELWEIEKPQAPEFCKAISESDFRTQSHLKPKGGKMWEGFDSEGKITHGTMGSEDTWSSNQKTIAQILTFPREVVINDDMGWINDALTLMLEGAIMAPDYQLVNLIYNAVSEGVTNTSGDNQNSYTLALTETNLSTVYKTIRRRFTDKDAVDGTKTVNGRFNTRWNLVVGPDLEETAWNILKQDRIVSNTTANTKQGDKNYWFNRLDIKVFENLDNDTYNSSARSDTWMLLPQRDFYAPFYIRYLNNQRSPVTETVDLPADELGFGVRGYWDVNLGYRPIESGKLQAFGYSRPTT